MLLVVRRWNLKRRASPALCVRSCAQYNNNNNNNRVGTHLEKPLQPPDLEAAVRAEHNKLEDAPPLDSRIGALSCIPVCPLAHNNVTLLVLDLRDELRQLTHCDVVSTASSQTHMF